MKGYKLLEISIICASIILLVLSFLRILPLRIAKVYLVNFFICLLGWEVWMTYGIINGDSEQKRGGDNVNPFLNMMMMTAGDGIVAVAQVEATFKAFGSKAFKKWNWKAFALIFVIGIVQNIVVTFILRKRLKGANISIAPLMPIKTNALLQNQEGWIIQPFILYALLVKFHKEILDIKD